MEEKKSVQTTEASGSAREIETYFDRLFPIARSLTGDGVRETLGILGELIPLDVHEVATGTKVLDWVVPREWNVREAFLETPDGRRFAEFGRNNLHVMGYSTPVDLDLSFPELEPHLRAVPELPDAIPYVTSYYRDDWGFCLSHRELVALPREGTYRAFIDATLEDGHLTYGDLVLPGETDAEVLFSTYVCHPSLANNELSGPLVAAFLYRRLAALPKRRLTYRFLFAPETIGALAYLARLGDHLRRHLAAGFVLTCVGTGGPLHYKRSRRGDSLSDRAAVHVLAHAGLEYDIREFVPIGSDERQYCSPGFNLPVGSLMRRPYNEYPEYHTSLDDKSLLDFRAMTETVETYFQVARALELNRTWVNTAPFGEPQLGRRNLYPTRRRTEAERPLESRIIMYLLNYADGDNDLLAISDRLGLPIARVEECVSLLSNAGLLRPA